MLGIRYYSAWWMSGLALCGIWVLYSVGRLSAWPAVVGGVCVAGLVAYVTIARARTGSDRPLSEPEVYYFFAPF